MNQEIADSEPVTPSRKRATVLLALGGYANTIITIVQGLVLVPLYLHYLGAHTYGLWLASGGMLGMLWLMNFGVGSLVTQRVAKAYGEKDFARAGAYFINGMFVYLFICLLYGLVGWIVSIWLAEILGIDGEEAGLLRQCFLVAVVAMTIAIFNECLRSYGQAMLRPVIPMLGMALGRILGIATTIWMLFDEFGLWAIPIGTLLAEVAILIVNALYVFGLFKKTSSPSRLDVNLIKEYVKTSPALLLAKSGNSMSQESEPLLITMFINAETTAAYMIARKAADMVFLMISVLNGAILGSFSHLAGEADGKKINQMVAKLSFLAFAVSLVGFSTYVAANNAFLSLWVGFEYVYSQELILVIGIGFFSRALRGMLWQILYAVGDFTVTSLVIFGEAIAKIGLVLGLFGLIGVAAVPYALALSGSVSLLALGLRLISILGLEIQRRSLLRMILSISGSVVVAGIFTIGNSWFSFVVTTAILVGSLFVTIAVFNWQTCKSYLLKGSDGISR